jgi:cytochrome c oxidase subunit 2
MRAVKLPVVLVLASSTAALVLVGLWVGYNVNVLPIDASSNAPTYDALFKVLFSIGTILFLGILILLLYSLAAFRRRPGDVGDGLALEGNLPLEIVWTAIPAVVVLFVGLYSYDIYERMGGMAPMHDHSAMLAMASETSPVSTSASPLASSSGVGASSRPGPPDSRRRAARASPGRTAQLDGQ